MKTDIALRVGISTSLVQTVVLCNMNIPAESVFLESLLQSHILTLVKLVLDRTAEGRAFVKAFVVSNVMSGTLVSVDKRNIVVV